MKNQADRFIPCVIGTVPVKNIGLRKTAHAPACIIANGGQAFYDFFVFFHLRSLRVGVDYTKTSSVRC